MSEIFLRAIPGVLVALYLWTPPILNTNVERKAILAVVLTILLYILSSHGFICQRAGALPEHHPHICQPDRVPVHEELPGPSHQISLSADLFAGCESSSAVIPSYSLSHTAFVLFLYLHV